MFLLKKDPWFFTREWNCHSKQRGISSRKKAVHHITALSFQVSLLSQARHSHEFRNVNTFDDDCTAHWIPKRFHRLGSKDCAKISYDFNVKLNSQSHKTDLSCQREEIIHSVPNMSIRLPLNRYPNMGVLCGNLLQVEHSFPERQ